MRGSFIMTKNKTKSKNPNMRTAIIRISADNYVHTDNIELGIKAGTIVHFDLEHILYILDEWFKTKGIWYYVILHDENPENKHFHIVIEFPKNSQCKFSTLKKKFPYGFIDSCRHGVHACVRYLTHCDHPEKHQYDWDDVVTNNPAKLERYKQPTKYNEMLYVNKIIEQICNGDIKEFEFPDKIEPALYVKYKTKFMNAVDFYSRKIINNPDRNIKVYVCQGPPRVGKSLFCKAWAKKHNKSVCFSSASRDPWQDYHGEDVFVYDDHNFESSKIEDFIKAFDPHNNTSIGARYHNKVFIGDTIFVCSNIPAQDWYKFEAEEIHRNALFSRIDFVLDFTDFDEAKGQSHYTVNTLYEGKEHDYDIGRLGIPHYSKKWMLKPVENDSRTFDLNKYIDVTLDKKKTEDFLNKLDDI